MQLYAHLWLLSYRTERAKCVIQRVLVDHLVQCANEEVRADVQCLLVVTSLVDSYWLSVQLYLVHDLAGVLGIVFRQELAEPETLVSHRDTIFW